VSVGDQGSRGRDAADAAPAGPVDAASESPAAAEQGLLTLKQVQQRLGLSRAVILGMVEQGLVRPARGPRRAWQFSFRDLLLLRTAWSLRTAGVTPRKVATALAKLRRQLPEGTPLTGLRLSAAGGEVVVTDRSSRWQPADGQLLFDFDAESLGGEPLTFEPTSPIAIHGRGTVHTSHEAKSPAVSDPSAASKPSDAEAHAQARARACFNEALSLEARAPAAAERAYREAIEWAPDWLDPYLNLGVLLSERLRDNDAIAIYSAGLVRLPGEPLLHYNLGVAFQDLGDAGAALVSYEHCLRIDPRFADAHYNSAQVLEQRGEAQSALRHLSEYRKLVRSRRDR